MLMDSTKKKGWLRLRGQLDLYLAVWQRAQELITYEVLLWQPTRQQRTENKVWKCKAETRGERRETIKNMKERGKEVKQKQE